MSESNEQEKKVDKGLICSHVSGLLLLFLFYALNAADFLFFVQCAALLKNH